jgi:hypothetical protein
VIIFQILQGLVDDALESVSGDVSVLIGLPPRADIGPEIINGDGEVEAVLREGGGDPKRVLTHHMEEDSEEGVGAMLLDHSLCSVLVTVSCVSNEDVSDEMVAVVQEAVVLKEEIEVRCLSLTFAVLQDPFQD